MACRQPSNKPLFEPTIASLLTNIFVSKSYDRFMCCGSKPWQIGRNNDSNLVFFIYLGPKFSFYAFENEYSVPNRSPNALNSHDAPEHCRCKLTSVMEPGAHRPLLEITHTILQHLNFLTTKLRTSFIGFHNNEFNMNETSKLTETMPVVGAKYSPSLYTTLLDDGHWPLNQASPFLWQNLCHCVQKNCTNLLG